MVYLLLQYFWSWSKLKKCDWENLKIDLFVDGLSITGCLSIHFYRAFVEHHIHTYVQLHHFYNSSYPWMEFKVVFQWSGYFNLGLRVGLIHFRMTWLDNSSEFLHILFSFTDFLNFPVLRFFFPLIPIFLLFVLPILWLQILKKFPFDELLPRCIILMRYKSHVTCLATQNLCSRMAHIITIPPSAGYKD